MQGSNVAVGDTSWQPVCCRDDWAAELRSTKSKLLQAEQLARAKETETEDLRKAYEVTRQQCA